MTDAASAMTRNPVTVRPDDSLVDAANIMINRGIRHLPVVDVEGRLLGMLSDRDLRAAVGDPVRAAEEKNARLRVQTLRVASIMSKPAYAVEESVPITDVARRFVDHKIGALPVVDAGGRVVGIISYVDVIRELLFRIPG